MFIKSITPHQTVKDGNMLLKVLMEEHVLHKLVLKEIGPKKKKKHRQEISGAALY
jgi:hypothetical protein